MNRIHAINIPYLPANLPTYMTACLPVCVRVFPVCVCVYLKSAILHLLIKDLDAESNKDILKNYRQVSNLVILSKLIESVVRIRLTKHMTENLDFQHGYKKGHSMETQQIWK